MERFFHRLHVRRESLRKNELSQRDQWAKDEHDVRDGSCEFAVKYLGCTEVFESKGVKICEEAYRTMKNRSRTATGIQLLHHSSRRHSDPRRYGCLHITGDGIKLADEHSEEIIVDTPIEQISYCCPDRHFEHAFAYICRDTIPWRWFCHVFEGIEDTGERLNHAVGVAFSICLEKRREAEMAKAAANLSNKPGNSSDSAELTTSRSGQFRQAPISERMLDPQASKIAEPVPRTNSDVALVSLDRPRASGQTTPSQQQWLPLMPLTANKEEAELNNN
jgi:hypothetical protein